MKSAFLWSAVALLVAPIAAGQISAPRPQQTNAPGSQTATPGSPAPSPESASQPVIVLDPGHGGADTGARGANGLAEKNLTLQFARVAQTEFERRGFRVLLTRSDDSDPSYDDRAAVANHFPRVIFISLHVASSGPAGFARAYYESPGEPPAAASGENEHAAVSGENQRAAATGDNERAAVKATSAGLTPWDTAQRDYGAQSERLAQAVQIELARQLTGSPQQPAQAALRDTRSVAAPAIAVELSSVSVSDSNALLSLAEPLAQALAQGVQQYLARSQASPANPPAQAPNHALPNPAASAGAR